jgi:cytochrome P450
LNTVSRGIGGFGMLWEMLSAARDHHFLELLLSWYREHGNTYKAKMVGRTIVFTIEPKNVQTVLALKFKDFELGSYRNNAFKPLLGQGIFASDGQIWEHSRALVRPNFVRNQITDIDIYETHVAKVIKLIPRDGSTVDLQDLFFRMVSSRLLSFLVYPDLLTHVLRPSTPQPSSSSESQSTLYTTVLPPPQQLSHRTSIPPRMD